MTSIPRLILLGGFLGSGKTTAAAELAERLQAKGLRVGLITNDQGSNLVDTLLLRGQGFATEEISGGCFCCRFECLVDASNRLARSCRPDVVIAEAVGSCTDLAATVVSPLRRMHGATVAPLSVLVDPIRARRALGLEAGTQFSADVLYIYRKQIEEADLIVIGKSDLLEREQLEELRGTLAREFPCAEVMAVSSHRGTNVANWLHRLLFGRPKAREAMSLDYDRYAEGEARLGCLNSAASVSSAAMFDPGDLLLSLATDINRRLREIAAEVAHLKIALESGEEEGTAISVIRLVGGDFLPEKGPCPGRAILGGRLVINLRAEADPRLLTDVIEQAAASLNTSTRGKLTLQIEKIDAFRPGRPLPTHRDKILA